MYACHSRRGKNDDGYIIRPIGRELRIPDIGEPETNCRGSGDAAHARIGEESLGRGGRTDRSVFRPLFLETERMAFAYWHEFIAFADKLVSQGAALRRKAEENNGAGLVIAYQCYAYASLVLRSGLPDPMVERVRQAADAESGITTATTTSRERREEVDKSVRAIEALMVDMWNLLTEQERDVVLDLRIVENRVGNHQSFENIVFTRRLSQRADRVRETSPHIAYQYYEAVAAEVTRRCGPGDVVCSVCLRSPKKPGSARLELDASSGEEAIAAVAKVWSLLGPSDQSVLVDIHTARRIVRQCTPWISQNGPLH